MPSASQRQWQNLICTSARSVAAPAAVCRTPTYALIKNARGLTKRAGLNLVFFVNTVSISLNVLQQKEAFWTFCTNAIKIYSCFAYVYTYIRWLHSNAGRWEAKHGVTVRFVGLVLAVEQHYKSRPITLMLLINERPAVFLMNRHPDPQVQRNLPGLVIRRSRGSLGNFENTLSFFNRELGKSAEQTPEIFADVSSQ